MGDRSMDTVWDRQVTLWDGHRTVRYSGSPREGLRIEGEDGVEFKIDPPDLAQLLDLLHSYNPLVDGSNYFLGLSDHDLINLWLWQRADRQRGALVRLRHRIAFRLGCDSHPAVQMPGVQRLHQVLAAEGLVPLVGLAGRPGDLPRLPVLDAIAPFKGQKILFFDRRPFTLARLLEAAPTAPRAALIGSATVTSAGQAGDDEEELLRSAGTLADLCLTFEAVPAPGCDWDGPATFSIAADLEMLSLGRGFLWCHGLGIAIVTAPELIEMALRVASIVQDPRKRRAGIWDVIHRRTSATVRPPSPY